MSKSVKLVLSTSGEVEAVVDDLGKALRYEVCISKEDKKELPEHIILATSKVPLPVEKAMAPFYDNMLASVLFPNCRVPAGMSHVTGSLYVLEMTHVPQPESFWPLNLQYGTGISMVEIEPRMNDEGLMLTKEYLSSQKIKNIVVALSEHLRLPGDPDLQPGVVLGDTLKQLKEFTSKSYENDPLMRTYRSDWDQLWRPCLGPDDYVALCVSDWQDASKETKEASGHTLGQKHWYIVCKFTLPMEVADQLMVTRFINPQQDTWETLINRKVFARAMEISLQCREKIIAYALEKLGMRKRLSNPTFTHTTWCELFSKPDQTGPYRYFVVQGDRR
jgi:hypothetical protein